MTRTVHVVAVSARTPVGLTAETSAAAVRAGITRVSSHPFILDDTGESIRCAMDGRLSPDLMGPERLLALAEEPLGQIMSDLGASSSRLIVDVVVGLPEERPGWTDADASRITQALQGWGMARYPGASMRVSTSAARGHAACLDAMHVAARSIGEGVSDLCIVGGIDSYLDLAALEWLQACRQLTNGEVRSGFFPGEGCGFVALASDQARRWLALASLAVVVGGGRATETRLIKTDEENLGHGMTAAISMATQSLRLPEESVDSIYCDINGERYRSEEWGLVVLRLSRVCRAPTVYEAPAKSWGDVGAASGALFTVLAVEAWRRGYARGPRALLWGGSERGLRAALVLQH